MVASRNQLHQIQRSFAGTQNGSLSGYFTGNALAGYTNPRELRNPVSSRKNVGKYMHKFNTSTLGGFGGPVIPGINVELTNTTMLALASIYVGLDFPGARSAVQVIKKVYDRPKPVIQGTLIAAGIAGIVYEQFKGVN
jgi:hypothetical protein